jgi:hypothetical protein
MSHRKLSFCSPFDTIPALTWCCFREVTTRRDCKMNQGISTLDRFATPGKPDGDTANLARLHSIVIEPQTAGCSGSSE